MITAKETTVHKSLLGYGSTSNVSFLVEFDEDKKREIPKLLIGAYADLIYLVDVPIGALS